MRLKLSSVVVLLLSLCLVACSDSLDQRTTPPDEPKPATPESESESEAELIAYAAGQGLLTMII